MRLDSDHNWRKPAIGCAAALLLLGILIAAGVMGARMLLKARPKIEPTETVRRGTVEIRVVETGAIEPVRKEEVKSKVGGRVSRLYVDEGDAVRQGQILASIDPQEVNSEVAALRAQLLGSQARLASARQSAVYQQSQTTTSIAQYERNVDVALARLQQAEAEANVQPKLTNQAIAIAQANLDAARSSLKASQDSLNLLVQSTHPQAVVSAQAAYDQAIAQADNDKRAADRQRQLFTKGFIAQQDVETASMQASISQAHVRDVKERLDRIKETNRIEEENARAQMASVAGQVRQMEAALTQAQASVLPMTTRRQLESARAAYRQAQAQLAAAQSGRSQDVMRVDEVAAAEADVQQIQNQLNEKLVNQGDTTLYSPMSGVVTKRYVEQGELITSAISSFSSGSPVFQVADLSTMLVKINVNEVDIAKIRPGMLTEVTIDGAPGVTFPGQVQKVSPSAESAATTGDTSSASTQGVIRFQVEIVLERVDPRLRPGMSARCAIIVARHKNVLRIPTNCVQGNGPQATVKVATQTMQKGQPVQTSTPRKVMVGLRGDDYVEVLSGLRDGEKVLPAAYTGPPRQTIEMRGGP